MRKRKDPERPIHPYRFWAKPIGSLPQSLWDIARGMQTLWNQLVDLREELYGEAQRTGVKFSWEKFNRQAAELVRESGLNWEAGPEVLDRYRQALRASARNQRGWPVRHAKLDRISVPHRFTRGGIPVTKLFSRRAIRFRFEPVEEWAYSGKTRKHTRARVTRGLFGLAGGEAVQFKTVLHRQIPEGALVKRVAWVGRRHPTRGWQWAIVIVVAERPRIAPERVATPLCAVDLGWRAMGSYVRVGMLCDGLGRCYELRLPLDAPTSQSRRYRLPSGFHELLAYDSEIGRLAEEVRKQIEGFPDILSETAPEEIQSCVRDLAKMRQSGLVHLLQALRLTAFASEAGIALESWLKENDRLKSLKLALSDRLIGRRRWLYQNLAVWLCRSYGTIVWEGEFHLKHMIARRDKPLALRQAGRYEKWAAIGELRQMIKLAASKERARLLSAEESGSTLRCHLCGEVAAGNRSRLFLTCPAGHRWDQNINAAHNLLLEARQQDSINVLELPAGEPEIPATLREVVVAIGSP